MNTRHEYNEMQAELKKIIAPYNIDIHTHDFFEDTLLIFADIEEKPNGCQFDYSNSKPHLTDFYFTISRTSARTFVTQMNSISADLDAQDLTDTSTRKINGKQTCFIRMNSDAIRVNLLPLISVYLKAHPDVANRYQLKTTYNEMSSAQNALFSRFGISVNITDCFEETLCYVVKKILNYLLPSVFFNHFPLIYRESSKSMLE